MTPMQEALVRDTIVRRAMSLTGERLAKVAEATGLDVAGFLRSYADLFEQAKEAAHPHSEDAGKPWPRDGSDWSDMAPSQRVYCNEGPQLASLDRRRKQEPTP